MSEQVRIHVVTSWQVYCDICQGRVDQNGRFTAGQYLFSTDAMAVMMRKKHMEEHGMTDR